VAKSSGRNRYLRGKGQGAGAAGPLGGLGGLGGGNPLAAAQEMLAKAQAELASSTVEGTAGGGAVRVTMSGEMKVTGIAIEPEVVDPGDVEMLQDLIMAAIADATEKASGIQAQSFGSITSGLNLPGLGLG
jgi:DNA-binding YbaB/EbfC family protein